MTTVKGITRRTARRVTDRLGHRTAGRRALPNMLIVGGQRCGTTTLYKALSEHPSFLGPNLRKGVHYFDLNFDESVDWYRAHFPTKSAVESVQHRTGDPVVVGESSPYYMWHPLAPDRIARTLPGVRVVVLLRDPVERAYSAHAHELARGFETEPFERRARARGRASRRTGTSTGVRGPVAQQGAPTPGVRPTWGVHHSARAPRSGGRPGQHPGPGQRRLLGRARAELAGRHGVPGAVGPSGVTRAAQRPVAGADERPAPDSARAALRAVR